MEAGQSLPTIGGFASKQKEAEERPEIEKFLEQLVQIRQAQDGWEYGGLFDLQRLIKEIGDQGAFDGAGFSEVLLRWATLQYQLRIGSIYQLEHNESTLQKFHLGRLHFSPDGSEVQAFVLCQAESEDTWWMRLWLIKRDGQWRLFDHQMLDSGKRFTTSLAELGSMTNPDKASWRRAKELVDLAWTSMSYGYGDENAIQANLQGAARFPRHPDTELRRQLYEFKLTVDNYAEEQAQQVLLQNLLRQDRVIERQPVLLRLQAIMADAHGRLPETVEACQTFLDYVGPDEEICRLLGTALMGLEKKKEAAEAFRLGLSINPSSFSCLTRLAECLPASGAGEIGERFARFDDPVTRFEAVATGLDSEDCADALLAVVEAYRQISKDDPDADYYEAKAWLIKREHLRAAKLLKAAMSRVDDEEERKHYYDTYMRAMLFGQLLPEVYQESEEKLADFRKLGSLVSGSGFHDQYRKLVDLHRKEHPRDPWLYYYWGGLEQEKSNYDEASELLATGMRYATDAETLDMIRMRRVLVMYLGDKGLDAYRTVPPRRKTFNELANRMSDDLRTKQLEKLTMMHREKDSRDPNLLVWEGEVHWLKKEYAEAAKKFIAAKSVLQHQDISYIWLEERLIRSLIRCERFEEAENIALGIKERDDSAWFPLMVYAVWQDEAAAMQAAAYCLEHNYVESEEFYFDEDLGPAIRKPAFAKFREKFPEAQGSSIFEPE